jgi:hypothetical protein
MDKRVGDHDTRSRATLATSFQSSNRGSFSMKCLSIAWVVPAALVGSACQALSGDVLSVEARAMVYDDSSVDDFDAATSFDREDVDATGYGVQAALNLPIVDIVAAVDRREFQDESVPELSIGLRRRVFGFWRLHPYVEGNLRFGRDLDTGVEEDDYTGWNAGLGAMLDVTDHWFLNVRLMYESTPLELPGDDTHIDGLIGTVGLGFAF